jgi:serine/threonine protein phosphatase 1
MTPPSKSGLKPLVVSDLHGRYHLLEKLLAEHPDRSLVFLGDFIDRGKQSKEVMQKVIELHKAGRATLLIGNHELLAKAALNQEPGGYECWVTNGGMATILSYNANMPEGREEFESDLNYIFANGLEYHTEDDVLIAHAGRPSCQVLSGTGHDDDHFWMRPYDRQHPLPFDIRFSVHGHTRMSMPTYVNDTSSWYIDLKHPDPDAQELGNRIGVFDLETETPFVLETK